MKKLYLIGYDINMAVKDYSLLYERIKELAGVGEYRHPLESIWLIYTDRNADEISMALRPYIEHSDRLLVMSVKQDCQGWMPSSIWNWINERL